MKEKAFCKAENHQNKLKAYLENSDYENNLKKGGSPGLVVNERNSQSRGFEFESQCRILDGHFSTLICCKIVIFD